MSVREDPISKQEFYELKREVRENATQSPLRSSSITEGRLRVGGSAILLIDSDGGVVIQGSLDGDGNITWTGIAEFTGSFKSTGPAIFDGDVDITKTLDVTAAAQFLSTLAVKGAATLENDLRVKSGGKITIEGSPTAELSQSGGVAMLKFGDGPRFYSEGATARMDAGSGTSRVSATPTSAGMYSPNLNSVSVSNGGATVGGPLNVSGVTTLANLATNTTSGTTYVVANATTGLLQRVSSASRFKLDQREAELPDALLDVRVKDWLDAGEVAIAFELNAAPRPWTWAQQQAFDGLGIRRIPGVVAEDVHAAGGALFNTFDADGQVEGVAYDRLAIARTQILADRLERALAEIAELREMIATAGGG